MEGGDEGDVAAAQQVVAMHDGGDDELRGAASGGGAELDGNAEVQMFVIFTQKDLVGGGFVDFEDADALVGGVCRGCGELFGGFQAETSDQRVAQAHQRVDPGGLVVKHVAGELLGVADHIGRQADGVGVGQLGRGVNAAGARVWRDGDGDGGGHGV